MKKLASAFAIVAVTACQTGPGAQPMADTTGSSSNARPAEGQVEATPQTISENFIKLNQSRQQIAQLWAGKSFAEFEETVTREAGTGHYIVNGDIILTDRKHLKEFFENEVLAGSNPAGLILNTSGGIETIWPDNKKRNLTYCVSDGFGGRKADVIADMQAAGAVWSAQGDIAFVYLPAQDANCNASNTQVEFDVRPVTGQQYLARAFFPNDSRGNRNVLIDDSSFASNPGSSLTLRGILRHELGHALGFRHEHTRPEAGTCFEDSNWVPLTEYDAFSVMHYPQCNGQGDWSLTLTDKDKLGICKAYGAGSAYTGDTSQCAAAPAPPPADDCVPQTLSASGNVSEGEEAQLFSLSVSAGGNLSVEMTGSGDPDLYVRFNVPPSEGDFDCRPFLTGPVENCDLSVPQNASEAHIMVRGYTIGGYSVEAIAN